MRDTLAEHYRRLLALGADAFPHVAGTLAPHLLRTASLLQRWGSRPALCVAGLYHAVYGTDGIRGSLVALDRRDAIAGSIGSDAEYITYLYGACDRDAFHPRIGTSASLQFVDRFTRSEYPIADTALRDFSELTLANELELAQSSDAFAIKHRGDLAEIAGQMRPFVSANAHDACVSPSFARQPMDGTARSVASSRAAVAANRSPLRPASTRRVP
jgi:hypothetical protein